MKTPLSALLHAWHRRWWRADPAALQAYAGLEPMVLVTGGSEGIGFELARRFAAAGNAILLIARGTDRLEHAAAAIRAESKVTVHVASIDLTAPHAIERMEAALASHRAYCDVLVNSAGIGISGPFHEQSPEGLAQLVDLNVRALTALTRHFLPGMRVRGRGGILNLASIGSFIPGPNQAAYYASKAYVLSLTEAIAAETAGEGVRVCALAPGPVDTRWHEKAGAQGAFYRSFVPRASPQSVAWAGYLGFMLGLRATIPGLINPFMAVALRIMPHRITVPIVGLLLRPRGGERPDAR